MQLVWLRHDLRAYDNPALSSALESGDEVAAIFVKCSEYQYSPWRQSVQLRCLLELQNELAELGVPLHFATSETLKDSVDVVLKTAKSLNAKLVHANRDHGVDELARDRQLEHQFASRFYGADTILPLGSVTNGQGAMYRVFTPFAKRWRVIRGESIIQPIAARSSLAAIEPNDSVTQRVNALLAELPATDDIPVSDQDIRSALNDFCDQRMAKYKENRDFPAVDGTSHLSPLLALGRLSAKRCLLALEQRESTDGRNTWLNEIIWREFYRHLMFAFPELSMSKPFQPYTDAVAWRTDRDSFQSWIHGKTGFPLVDAAMRCLKQTGWMHNRLRMVVASFLCKDLGIDWRLGEQYFLEQLVDADFPSNNGGWQWAASTGADAAPYFRIFNPVRQSERFDPEGEFIRAWVPELKTLTKKSIHQPNSIERLELDYPNEIVDRRAAKEWVVNEFKMAKQIASPVPN